MSTKKGMQGKVYCRQCRHFFITYEPRQPMGCRAYGFKSKQVPSGVVQKSSGQPCKLFDIRTVKK